MTVLAKKRESYSEVGQWSIGDMKIVIIQQLPCALHEGHPVNFQVASRLSFLIYASKRPPP